MRLPSLIYFLLFVPAAMGQAVSVGFVAGVPITDVVRTGGLIGERPFRVDVNRFTIGPVVRVRLPKGFGLEAGVLYKRFEQQAGQMQVTAEPGTPLRLESLPYSAFGASWEFAVLGQYRFGDCRVRPYVEAGVTFNNLRGVLAPFRTLASFARSTTLQPAGQSETRTGFSAGAGLDFKLPAGRLSGGFRCTRYGKVQEWLPSAAPVDLLVRPTF